MEVYVRHYELRFGLAAEISTCRSRKWKKHGSTVCSIGRRWR